MLSPRETVLLAIAGISSALDENYFSGLDNDPGTTQSGKKAGLILTFRGMIDYRFLGIHHGMTSNRASEKRETVRVLRTDGWIFR